MDRHAQGITDEEYRSMVYEEDHAPNTANLSLKDAKSLRAQSKKAYMSPKPHKTSKPANRTLISSLRIAKPINNDMDIEKN